MAQGMTYMDKPWLKSYEKGVPESIKFEELSMLDFLERSVKDFPDEIALIFLGYKVTFRQFKDQVDRFAACLTDFGVKQGDAVSILLPNSIPCVVAYYSILKIGAIVVMNNPLYSDPELQHQFNDSGSKVLITLDALGNRMINLRPKTKIKQIVYMGIGDYLSPIKRVLGKWLKKYPTGDVNAAADVYTWKDCITKYQPNPPKVKINFSDVAMYQYTGGTTGVSKGVMLTHENMSKQVQQCAAWFPKFGRGKEIMLGALPYFHVFGITTAMNFSILKGWTQVLVPRPQPEPLLENIRKFRPTFTPLVPTMYIGMLSHPDLKKTDMSCVKGAFSGSAPLPVEVIQEFEKVTGAFISEGFGMTETCPVTHINPFAGGARKPGSVGVPISDTLSRIVNIEDGVTDMPFGERGELIVKGPQVMKGYKGMDGETANVLKDGWMHTGDIATMDEDGYFYIVDRIKDMIISGGYNVYPRDIDGVYYGHPKVEECCSIGIPDPKSGEKVKLFVVLKQGQTATAEEMKEFGRAHLAVYKLPSEVEFRTELPKSNVGKILRKELRAQELEKRKKK